MSGMGSSNYFCDPLFTVAALLTRQPKPDPPFERMQFVPQILLVHESVQCLYMDDEGIAVSFNPSEGFFVLSTHALLFLKTGCATFPSCLCVLYVLVYRKKSLPTGNVSCVVFYIRHNTEYVS
jgi:hypothetical protein